MRRPLLFARAATRVAYTRARVKSGHDFRSHRPPPHRRTPPAAGHGRTGLPRARRAADSRCRLRPAAARTRSAGGGPSAAGQRRFAQPPDRRQAVVAVSRGGARGADAVAGQCLQRRGSARLRAPHRRAPAAPHAGVFGRAQARWAGDQPALRGRRVRAGRDPRRRQPRRGRHCQPASCRPPIRRRWHGWRSGGSR